jgi:hypothetical protein
MAKKLFVCTEVTPWDSTKGPAEHEDAVIVAQRDFAGVKFNIYRCPNCGLYFRVKATN